MGWGWRVSVHGPPGRVSTETRGLGFGEEVGVGPGPGHDWGSGVPKRGGRGRVGTVGPYWGWTPTIGRKRGTRVHARRPVVDLVSTPPEPPAAEEVSPLQVTVEALPHPLVRDVPSLTRPTPNEGPPVLSSVSLPPTPTLSGVVGPTPRPLHRGCPPTSRSSSCSSCVCR